MFCHISIITQAVFTVEQTLAQLVTEKDLSEGRLYPPLSSIGVVSRKLAVKVRAQLKSRYIPDHVCLNLVI